MEGVYFRLMDISVKGAVVNGEVKILSSKSELHRLLIISAFAKDKTRIEYYGKPSKDVLATLSCIRALGALVAEEEGAFIVTPIKEVTKDTADVFCNESGSTLRFILPVFSAVGKSFSVTVGGRLNERPLSPMYEILAENGVKMSGNGSYPLSVSGRFTGGNVSIKGDVSSQFISGLLMAMPLTENGGSVTVTGDFQSRPYVDITIDAMKKFGVTVEEKDGVFTVSGKYQSSGKAIAGGDWSNTAFFACMGAIGGKMKVSGLEGDSLQGDKKVMEVLSRFGAKVSICDGVLTVEKDALKGTKIDAKDIPDLIPTLAVVASVAEGETVVYNAERLRIKESDRIKSVMDMINSLGGEAVETADGLIIKGKSKLTGGVVDSCNDHRIVMSACVASLVTDGKVTIKGANAVEKSYPQFFEIIRNLGLETEEI